MHPTPSSAARAAACGWIGIAIVTAMGHANGDPPLQTGTISVVLETAAGGMQHGTLAAVDADRIRLQTASGDRDFTIADVRTVANTGTTRQEPLGVRLIGAEGWHLSGTDVAWSGTTVQLAHPAGPITVPVTKVRTIIWDRSPAGDVAAKDPAWLDSLPEELDSDVVVVAKGDGVQFVTCAIVDISAASVTVTLDGETIPVKRERVVGIHWLRERAAPGRIAVRVAGGSIGASRISWSPQALVVDEIEMPAAMLEAIDYSAGRTVRLATLPTERLVVEPFFGSLAEIPGLADFFRPHVPMVRDAAPGRDLVIRPRTAAVWRIPDGSRSFSARVSGNAPESRGGSVVVIAVDDTEVFRGPVDHATAGGAHGTALGPFPLEGARRLSITVDYGDAGPAGGVVVLQDPVFER